MATAIPPVLAGSIGKLQKSLRVFSSRISFEGVDGIECVKF
jgi:hypothetical protein